MNPAQQKTHTKRTDELEQMVTDLGTVVYDRIDKSTHYLQDQIRSAVSEETTRRLKLAKEQRDYVDGQDELIRKDLLMTKDAYLAFRKRAFWQRFKWLFLGQ